MCMFSGPIQRVSGTNIFVRADGERQVLIYGMSLSTRTDVAMVLPLPVPPTPGEDAVSFVDLSGYDDLFDDLGAIFPVSGAAPRGAPQPQNLSLKVHDVGSFEASFVPSMSDFGRLDSRFQLSSEVWAALPQYADWGFAVFKLKPGTQKVHPMALTFPRRDSTQLYFPTVHVHDGAVHPEARFDHRLFYQPSVHVEPEPPKPPVAGAPASFPEWLMSWKTADTFVKVALTHDLIRADRHVFGRALHGSLPNRDIFVDDPLS